MTLYIDFDLLMLERSDTPPASVVRSLTLAGPVSGKGRWICQTRCGDTFGTVEMRLEPYHGRSPFQLVWQVTEAQIPGEFLPGVLAGIRQAIHQARFSCGLLTNIKIIVVGGVSHPVDSGPQAFARATQKAFEDALAKTELVPV